MAVTETIKSIVGFLTQGFEQGNETDVFETLGSDIDDIEYPVEDNTALKPIYNFQSKNEKQNDMKVVAHPNYKGYEVMVLEPHSFGEAGAIVQHLKEKKTIVLNLHLMDKEQSQRTIDFICGAAHALNGKPQKVGDMVFVFTPNNVILSVENTPNQAKFNDSLWSRPLTN